MTDWYSCLFKIFPAEWIQGYIYLKTVINYFFFICMWSLHAVKMGEFVMTYMSSASIVYYHHRSIYNYLIVIVISSQAWPDIVYSFQGGITSH
jgi:hypothetical protein